MAILGGFSTKKETFPVRIKMMLYDKDCQGNLTQEEPTFDASVFQIVCSNLKCKYTILVG
jgi:hypothetical protein